MAEQQPTNRGAWLPALGAPLEMRDLPMPKATSGSVVVQVLATLVLPYLNKVHDGTVKQANLRPPLVPNANCIGRICEIGPDATILKPGDIVWADSTIAARDNPSVHIVQGHLGGEGDHGRKLQQVWRDGSFQKYQEVPLESCHLLDIDFLGKELGYTVPELPSIILFTVAAGAILEVAKVKPGDVMVLGPATGSFSGCAVELALLCGASVIVLGRSEGTLSELKKKLGNPRMLQSVVMTGDVEADAQAIRRLTPNGKGADIYNDWTPGWLEKPPYLASGLRVLKESGRVVFSGAAYGSFEIPYATSIHMNWQFTARWTCTRETIERVVQMINTGVLRIGKSAGAEITTFPLDQHQEAKDYSEKNGRFKNYTVLTPHELK